jgi:hypothetical protein
MSRNPRIVNRVRHRLFFSASVVCTLLVVMSSVTAAQTIEGQVTGAGAPISRSAVTLWSASPTAPKQLAQTQTGDDGRFTLNSSGAASPEDILYIVAKGGK